MTSEPRFHRDALPPPPSEDSFDLPPVLAPPPPTARGSKVLERLLVARLAVHVRTRREALAMTQEELAQRAGIHPRWIEAIESGELQAAAFTLAMQILIASALQVDPGALVARST